MASEKHQVLLELERLEDLLEELNTFSNWEFSDLNDGFEKDSGGPSPQYCDGKIQNTRFTYSHVPTDGRLNMEIPGWKRNSDYILSGKYVHPLCKGFKYSDNDHLSSLLTDSYRDILETHRPEYSPIGKFEMIVPISFETDKVEQTITSFGAFATDIERFHQSVLDVVQKGPSKQRQS